jgi:hypothetical protein
MLGYIFDNHDEEGQFDAQRLGLVLRTGDEGCGNVGSHDFKHGGLNILIGEALYVPVVNCIVSNLLCLSQI